MPKLTQAQLKQYEEQGYIVFEHLFGEDEIDAIRGHIDRLDEESARRLQKGRDFISAANEINFTSHLNYRHPDIQRFIADERFAAITTTLLGPDTRLYWDQSVYKRPEAKRDFPWHQDNGYVPTEPVHYVTCWLALEDATIENGCIYVQPGSHKQGFVEHVHSDIGYVCYQGDDPGIPVELKKGSMVAFHSLLFHRSTPNRSQTTRKGYVIQYSVVGSYNPETGSEFLNGPIIARDGRGAYAGFVTQEEVEQSTGTRA
ncbi:Ectoine hydroxylase-related dioxygenase, phytanoyl-CoA dioxygenase (PhyH) family [Paenibacillus sp. UNC496MF]|uniref:phytanoyl-CoA dioxygenase family protein n=1 Tax=Paenibacillus sp. UNC496MF TaxID=1502753 RepID=UPI0008E51C70|nr:phytanoyl-CoA dioxygenase family protein [Paenibacillus sp. UNC496MF]SFJ79069.1 Ectoine hydroxylase-related dioxygenase, phytanoyl-CoA dioxygenase (PhyH) family [Paenibacillus sp. UNC496MF]